MRQNRLHDLGEYAALFRSARAVPGRRSLRATSSALCSVAIPIVEPASLTARAPRTASRAGSPHVPLNRLQRRRRLLRGKLEGGRPAGELCGRAQLLARSASSSTLTTTHIGVESRDSAACRPIPGRTRPPGRRSRSGASARRRQPLGAGPRAYPSVARTDRRSAATDRRRAGRRTRRDSASTPAAGSSSACSSGGVAGVGIERIPGVLVLAVDPLERGARQVDLAAQLNAAAVRCCCPRPPDGAGRAESRESSARSR